MKIIEKLLRENYISDIEISEFVRNHPEADANAEIEFLLSSGLADKKMILRTLSEFFDIPSIDLSTIEPVPEILKMIPYGIVDEFYICPFAICYQTNSLKIACLTKLSGEEIQKLKEVCGVDSIDCFITYRNNLLSYKLEHYRSEYSQIQSSPELDNLNADGIQKYESPGIVVISLEKNFEISFWEEISKQNFDVYLFDNQQEAVELIEKRKISKLFIKSNDKKIFSDLVERCKYKNSTVSVRYFLEERNLVFEGPTDSISLGILKDNFSFLKKTVIGVQDYKSKHIDELVTLVEQLCDKLCLSELHTLSAVGAAYFHDITHYVMDNISQTLDVRDICNLSAEYLKSFKHSQDICKTIRLMYTDINEVQHPEEMFLPANIITAADYFCHSGYNRNKLSVELYKKFKEEFTVKSGKQFLPLVIDTLAELIYERVYIARPIDESCAVLVYNNSGEDKLLLKNCLENLGFDVSQTGQIDDFSKQYAENKPDILVIEVFQNDEHTTTLLNSFKEHGVNFETLPAYILSHQKLEFNSSDLLQRGIEDIFYVPQDIDPFLIKIIRSKKRVNELSKQNMKILSGKGTFGSLKDMNIIDLLQTMNGSGKTFVISITANAQQLTIYVDNGIIIGAEADDVIGVEAIFNSILWNEGVWNIDPILLENIPEPNINRTINSVLLEGCQHLDEGQTIETTASIDNFNFPE